MKLLLFIHKVYVGGLLKEISVLDFYVNINLHPYNCILKIKPREKYVYAI